MFQKYKKWAFSWFNNFNKCHIMSNQCSLSFLFWVAWGSNLFLIIWAAWAILDILILNLLSCSWIYKFFNDFCIFISISIYSCFFSNGFGPSIFYNSLLAYWFSHSSASHTKTTRLKWLKVSTSSLTHLHTSHWSETTSTKKVIIIMETKTLERISHFILLHLITTFLRFLPHSSNSSHTSHSLTESHLHMHVVTKSMVSESTIITKEIIIVIKETFEWIISSKEVFKYFVCWLHIKMSEILLTKLLSSSFSWSHSPLFYIFSSISIIVMSFLLVRKYSICIWNLFENFFGLFFIIGVLIWMVF